MSRFFPCLIALFVVCGGAHAQTNPTPLPRAHAHNDYEHARPLFEALENGFGSVEADIFLVDGKLLVAHNRKDVKPERTLESLYLNPLQARVRANGGHVYKESPLSLVLLVDIKEQGAQVYEVLRSLLRRYEKMLTRWDSGKTIEGAVTVILSGDRPTDVLRLEKIHYAAIDGRLSDLDAADAPVSLFPLISQEWNAVSQWYGRDAFPDADRKKLRDIVAKAHAQGRKLRFWATGNSPMVWRELYDAGVDLLNADDLRALRIFFTEKSSRPKPKSGAVGSSGVFPNVTWVSEK